MTQIISSSACQSTAGKSVSVWYDTCLLSFDTNNIISIQFNSFLLLRSQIITYFACFSTAGRSDSVCYDTHLLWYDTNNFNSIHFIFCMWLKSYHHLLLNQQLVSLTLFAMILISYDMILTIAFQFNSFHFLHDSNHIIICLLIKSW